MHHLLETKAPMFKVQTVSPQGGIEHICLQEIMNKNKWMILFFYPGNFALESPAYITILSDRYDEFKQIQTEVIGISSDTIYTHFAWIGLRRQEGGAGPLQISLASDRNFAVSLAYGVLDKEQGLPEKAVFIIDPSGKIRYIKQYKRQIHYNIDELLKALVNLQRR